MEIPYIRGRVAKQAHVEIPPGTYEEEVGRRGFFGKYAHLYRANSPVDWTRIEGPLRPRAYDLRRVPSGGDFISARRPFLANSDVRLSFAKASAPMGFFFRNADGDELWFAHQGEGRIETDFGALSYRPGDYVLIPRGCVFRVAPRSESAWLVIESFSEVGFPDRGMLGQHALFDPAVLRVPNPEDGPLSLLASQKEYELRIQRAGEVTHVFYPHNPLDTLGWKGTLSALQLNVADIRPVSSDRYHLPPSAHTTFVAQEFVVCTFLPRPLETGDEKAMRVPFYHSNIDYDEVLFYHDGEFFSRSGIDAGMVTFHPQGIHHGPHRKAVERSARAERTNEIAVMIDTRRPLVPVQPEGIELVDYWKSWRS